MRARIDRYVTAADLTRALAEDVRRGLTSSPKVLPPKYFYDARGSQLFEQITRLPEYYLTRAERTILDAHAEQVAKLAGADTLVELGSGSSEKTRLLLDAMRAVGELRQYVPFDVSHSALLGAVKALEAEYPAVEIHGLVADLDHHLHLLPDGGARLVAFIGGTIGNLTPSQRARFLTTLRATLGPEDTLLLGVDLVKDPEPLLAAYDDPAGLTAEFNRNVLHVINRELGADFAVDAFAHVALWDTEQEWIEMRLRARAAQTVVVRSLDLTVSFDAGEDLRTEISAKFRRAGIETELTTAGFSPAGWWTDPDACFALSLARAQPRRAPASRDLVVHPSWQAPRDHPRIRQAMVFLRQRTGHVGGGSGAARVLLRAALGPASARQRRLAWTTRLTSKRSLIAYDH